MKFSCQKMALPLFVLIIAALMGTTRSQSVEDGWLPVGNNCSRKTTVDSVTEMPKTIAIACMTGRYDFPGNFDVSLVDPKVTELYIKSFDKVVSVVNDNYIPLPARVNLVKVQLHSFNTKPSQPRFPLNGFFQHNKQHIQDLQLEFVKLVTLTAEDFAGFNQLENLGIHMAQLTSVSVSTFSNLGVTASGPRLPAVLKDLTISANYGLTTFDWSTLKPLAGSLETIRIHHNEITSAGLTASTPFILPKAKTFKFESNNLTFGLPAAVFQTFNASLDLDINISGMQTFCRDASDCGCCDLAEFAAWLKKNNQLKAAMYALRCGRNGERERNVFRKYSYAHCTPVEVG